MAAQHEALRAEACAALHDATAAGGLLVTLPARTCSLIRQAALVFPGIDFQPSAGVQVPLGMVLQLRNYLLASEPLPEAQWLPGLLMASPLAFAGHGGLRSPIFAHAEHGSRKRPLGSAMADGVGTDTDSEAEDGSRDGAGGVLSEAGCCGVLRMPASNRQTKRRRLALSGGAPAYC